MSDTTEMIDTPVGADAPAVSAPAEPFYEAPPSQEPSALPTDNFRPMSEYSPVKPENGVTYIPDDEFEVWKSTVAQTQPVEGAAPEAVVPPSTEPVVVADATAPVFDAATWLKEKSAGKFQSEEEFIKFVTEMPAAPVQPELTFADDESKKIFELFQSGKKKEVLDFYQHQAFLDSVPEMGDEDAVKSMLVMQDPEATDADIHWDFINRVGEMPIEDRYDADNMEEYRRDLHQWKRKVKMVASEARTFLEGQRKAITLPDLPKKETNVGFSSEELSTIETEFATGIKNAVEAQIGSLSSIKVPVVDKDQGIDFVFEAIVSDQDKAALKGNFQDYLQDFDTRYGKGSSYDGAKLARDRFVADNFEKIIASASKAAYAKGKLSVINTQSNANLTQTLPPTEFAADKYVQEGRNFIHGRR